MEEQGLVTALTDVRDQLKYLRVGLDEVWSFIQLTMDEDDTDRIEHRERMTANYLEDLITDLDDSIQFADEHLPKDESEADTEGGMDQEVIKGLIDALTAFGEKHQNEADIGQWTKATQDIAGFLGQVVPKTEQ